MLPLSPRPPTTRNYSSPLQLSLEEKNENIKIGLNWFYFISKRPLIFPDELDQVDAKFCILFDCFFCLDFINQSEKCQQKQTSENQKFILIIHILTKHLNIKK